MYSKNGAYENHFHVKELNFSEFDSLLKKEFREIHYFGQRLQVGSVIQSIEVPVASFRVWGDNGESIQDQVSLFPDPVYYIAMCANSRQCLPEICSSALYPTTLDLLGEYRGYAAWAKSTDLEIEKARQIIDTKEQEHERMAIWAKKLNEELQDFKISYQALREECEKITEFSDVLRDKLEQARQIIGEQEQEQEQEFGKVVSRKWAFDLTEDIRLKQNELNQILASNSWLITKPFREIRRLINSPDRQFKRYLATFLTVLKYGYQKLPLSYVARNRHKALVERVAPWALRLSNSSSNFEYFSLTKDAPELHSRALEIDFSLPVFTAPIVSVIIPIYGKVEFTMACLRSIAKHLPAIPFEVIVIDDCSPDNSVEILTKILGLKIYSNKLNEGFIKSCNMGARISKGQYLYFLNNDTEVTSGWLDNLYETFSNFPGTGFVGSKLIYPDGSLQEAGGIIWRDGSAWNFGRNQDANIPSFNYAREVDYCSGASIMVPRNIFDEIGGFDEIYAPAYCEDSDLALKIRQCGYRVIYQPTSVVIHFEGITSGTDTDQGVKSYQIENSKKLFDRWKDFLKAYQLDAKNLDDAKDRASTKRVLVLDHCTPTPNQDAGSVTVVNTLILLRELGFQVTFIPEDNFLYMPNETMALQKIGIEILYAPYVYSVKEHVEAFGSRYDLVFLFRPVVVERNIEIIRKNCLNAKILFHTIDLHFLRLSREALHRSDKSTQAVADQMRLRELSAISCVDATIVHSTAEFEILRPLVPNAKLHVFPLILEVKGARRTFKERRDILFIGGFQHAPNIDAVHFFAKEIMPILRKKIPGIRFLVVGSKPPLDILNLSSEDVRVLGYMEDLDVALNSARVSVAPLRYGAGIKGKVGTAMAAGLPVVGTSIAAEGMLLSNDENILLADTPEEFANKVCALYSDEDLWRKISSNSVSFAERTWGANVALRILSNIIEDIGIGLDHSKKILKLYSSGK